MLNKFCYLYAKEYHSVIMRNQLLMHTTWMNLQRMMLNVKNQFQKVTYGMILFI